MLFCIAWQEGAVFRIRPRPGSLPRFWRNVAKKQNDRAFARDCLLVLRACGIPYKTNLHHGMLHIYVPPLLEQHALTELDAYAREWSCPKPISRALPVFPHPYLATLGILPLILWHGWRVGWWNAPSCLPSPQLWADAGMLDSIRICLFHEWHRIICSLTLHGDAAHLFANVTFGALFLTLLARLIGIGRALWLCVLGGICGNGLSLFLRQTDVQSMGFSTALFAIVGVQAGFLAGNEQHRRKSPLPIAAAVALLAMLGTEGEHTDYVAHCSGLFCGLLLGVLEAWRKCQGTLHQVFAALAALLLPCLAWFLAFAQ
ncbi:MAG: rhomboid family intramembrane serine protease [Desulfovibrio sp.]|nr:rhomboid family intramembrane serine protease [Desulfovibrio sp.]